MDKRKIVFGTYDTATDGLLTLTGWQFSAPAYKPNFVTVPGRDGELDLSTALTDGEPRYSNRTLEATFESSEGTRLDRLEIFNDMRQQLDGQKVQIILPDDDGHYVVGRLQVSIDYNDMAHGALTVVGNCEPWRYAVIETVHVLTASATVQQFILENYGRRTLIPTVIVTGSVDLSYGSSSWSLSAGTYVLPGLVLRPGANIIGYSGSGTLTVKYREAVL